MIGFAQGLIEDLIVRPQDTPDTDDDRRIYLDPDSAPIDSTPQEVDVIPMTTTPLRYEIGGSLEVRHRIDVAVDVQHGSFAEARRRRDLIVLDLCLRALWNVEAIMSAVDPETGQYPTGLEWSVNYLPLGTTATGSNESATITFTVDVQIDTPPLG